MSLLEPTFLFRFSVPCLPLDSLWSNDAELPESFQIPSFSELEDAPQFADVRMGWHADGIGVSVRVTGKKQPTWCRSSRIEDSDGIAIWIDTRDTQNIHRASRFCHHFIFCPQGTGKSMSEPVGRLIQINRAKDNPKPVKDGDLKLKSKVTKDGYVLRAAIPASALTGYDPQEQRRMGFTFAVMDRELGWQTFSISNEFPIESDPSLWGTVELVEA
ncbi:MAG: sugar-binding protein [Planctomycetota bacterium]